MGQRSDHRKGSSENDTEESNRKRLIRVNFTWTRGRVHF